MNSPDRSPTSTTYCVKNIASKLWGKWKKKIIMCLTAQRTILQEVHSCEIMVGVIAAQEGGIGIRIIHHY